MYVQYAAIDGFELDANAVLALMMTDTAADIDADQSGNSNDFTITGAPTTAAVVTGAETLAQSGYTNAIYMERAYDADFDFGTSGFSARIWFKTSSSIASTDCFFERNSATPNQGFFIKIASTGVITATVDDGTTAQSVVTTGSNYADDVWHLAEIVFDGQDLFLYIDGALFGSDTSGTMLTISNVTAVFTVGATVAHTEGADATELAGLHVTTTVRTAQQIRTTYDNEKVLFNQYEPYSQIGVTKGYEVGLSSLQPGIASKDAISEKLDGSRDGLNWYRKNTFNCTTVAKAGRAERGKAEKFLRSTFINAFTFDERGTEATADNPIQVYRTAGGQIQRRDNDGEFYQYNFLLQEV